MLPQERVSGNGLAQCQGGSKRSLGIISMGARQTEDRHHCIANKLLQSASMMTNDTKCMRVIASHQVARILRIKCLTQGCGLRYVGKEDGHEPALFRYACCLRERR